MSLADFCCVSCGAKCWVNDRDVAARIRVIHRMCRQCDLDAGQDVRVAFGAIERRERPRLALVPPAAPPLPSTLGKAMAACVVLALVASFVVPVVVEPLLWLAIAAGVLWFGQLAGRFVA